MEHFRRSGLRKKSLLDSSCLSEKIRLIVIKVCKKVRAREAPFSAYKYRLSVFQAVTMVFVSYIGFDAVSVAVLQI